jgi:hypothetical protein
MNMKAERLTDNESQLIDSVSDVDFEHIIDNLNYSISFVNELFGLDISFSLNEEPKNSVVDNYDENGDEEDGNSDTGNGVQGTETSGVQSEISGEQNVSDRTVDGSPDSENNALGENTDEQGTDSELSNDTEEENNEEVNNGVNVEINIETESAQVDADTDDDNSSDTSVVDNSDEDEEVKKNETSNA